MAIPPSLTEATRYPVRPLAVYAVRRSPRLETIRIVSGVSWTIAKVGVVYAGAIEVQGRASLRALVSWNGYGVPKTGWSGRAEGVVVDAGVLDGVALIVLLVGRGLSEARTPAAEE